MMISVDYWLSIWIDPRGSFLEDSAPDATDIGFWIPIYVGLMCVAAVLVWCRGFLTMCQLGITAARVLYTELSAAIRSAPMVFFETTPSGRILNRFTADTEVLDNTLLMTAQQWLNCVTVIVGALTITAIINPWFLAVLPLVITVFLAVYCFSIAAARDLKRIEAVSKSPIFVQFAETLQGVSTIRAFGAERQFELQNARLVDESTRAMLNKNLVEQWVTLRLDSVSALITFATILLPVLTLEFGGTLSASPAAFGLCISYALELTTYLKHVTKMTQDLEASFSSVERINEYIMVTPEKGGGDAPPLQWPAAGAIDVHDLCVRYRPELPYALKNVTCAIPSQAKVGVVGRTGSGKSTFVSTLWRLVELSGGRDGSGAGALQIDGVDLRSLSLPKLRSRLAIIPQDPVLFNESLQYNLVRRWLSIPRLLDQPSRCLPAAAVWPAGFSAADGSSLAFAGPLQRAQRRRARRGSPRRAAH
jgi:ABC-type multidrug transport system fused ATPase/permease subunit